MKGRETKTVVSVTTTRNQDTNATQGLAKSKREAANTGAEYIRAMRLIQQHGQDFAPKTHDSPKAEQNAISAVLAEDKNSIPRLSSPLDDEQTLQKRNADLEAKCKKLTEELDFTTSKLESSESLRISELEAYYVKYGDLKADLVAMGTQLQQLHEAELQRLESAEANWQGSKFPSVMIKGLLSTIADEMCYQDEIDREGIARYCEEILVQLNHIDLYVPVPPGEDSSITD